MGFKPPPGSFLPTEDGKARCFLGPFWDYVERQVAGVDTLSETELDELRAHAAREVLVVPLEETRDERLVFVGSSKVCRRGHRTLLSGAGAAGRANVVRRPLRQCRRAPRRVSVAKSPVARTPTPKPASTPVRSTHAGKPTSGSEIDAPMTPTTLPRKPPITSSARFERISFAPGDVWRAAAGLLAGRALRRGRQRRARAAGADGR